MIGFKWIIENELAGASQPGLYASIDQDLEFLRARRIDYIISLTETNELSRTARVADMGYLHFPIRDMDIPMPRDASNAMTKIERIISLGHVPLIHCKAGVGRTGMIAACYMVTKGYETEEAIKYVRSIQPRYIQTLNQQRFVSNFAKYHIKDHFQQ